MESFGVPPQLSDICSDLISRQCAWSEAAYAEAVVDAIFNDSRFDLLNIFNSASFVDDSNFARVVEIIGTKSRAFKVLVEQGGRLFEHFVHSFASHLERSLSTYSPRDVENSLYMHLLSEYVIFMMPAGEERFATTFDGDELCDMRSETGSFATPLNVFNEENLRRYAISPSAQSLKALRSFSESLSAQFIPFVHILVTRYCSLSTWPSEYRLSALRYVLKEVHVFCWRPTENSALAQLKSRLRWSSSFSDALFEFITSMFRNWPPVSSFSSIFDVWVTWIRPYRYVPSRHADPVRHVMPFVLANKRFYTILSDVFWRRAFPMQSADQVRCIQSYVLLLTAPELVTIYDHLNYTIDNHIRLLTRTLKNTELDLREKYEEEKASLATVTWIVRVIAYEEAESRVRVMEDALAELSSFCSILECSVGSLDEGCSEERRTPSGNRRPALTRSFVEPKSRSAQDVTPDHVIDPETKLMRATALGRQQILRGTHRFDFSRCKDAIAPLVAPVRSDEIWWLSRLLYKLSVVINRTTPIICLSAKYQERSLLGLIARLVLDPEYPRVVVPVFTETIPVQKPCVNLRYLARYRIVTPLIIFFILSIFIRFPYALFSLAILLVVTYFS